jgi:hypothetical protein
VFWRILEEARSNTWPRVLGNCASSVDFIRARDWALRYVRPLIHHVDASLRISEKVRPYFG